MRGNAEGEMLVQDEKDGEIRAVIPVHPSADWQEESAEFHICLLYTSDAADE